ncbi:MAG: flagellar export chaperone FlgN [Phycisphaeraceae bacterium]|nr:flagellar export chaperone FlgN [Phycisphaeraceae bacterium]
MDAGGAGRDEQLWLINAGEPTPHTDPNRWGPRLLRLLDEQVESARKLAALAAEQGEAVALGDIEALARVLGEREPVVAALTESAGRIEPFVRTMGGMASVAAGVPAVLRQGLEARVRELDALLEEIGRRDEADALALGRNRERLALQLSEINGGRAAIAAYGKQPEGEGGGAAFQDRAG